jgi:hypothetical protein
VGLAAPRTAVMTALHKLLLLQSTVLRAPLSLATAAAAAAAAAAEWCRALVEQSCSRLCSASYRSESAAVEAEGISALE